MCISLTLPVYEKCITFIKMQTIMKIIIWWRESNLTKLSRESEKTLVEWF